MSPAAFRKDISTLAQLARGAVTARAEPPRLQRVKKLLKHLASSPAFSLALFLVFLVVLFLTVFEVLPPWAPALFLCYPFGLGLVAHLVDALVFWRGRRYLSSLWSLVWVAILAIINAALVAIVVWSGQAA
jgi:hypothetical protein